MHDLTFPLRWRVALVAPALAVFLAFWLLPMVALVQVSADAAAKFLPASDYARARPVDFGKMAEKQQAFGEQYLQVMH